ncbi:hypothetical protein SK128_022830 [Halocaridina rubra]|uniref:WD repeat-containing protein 75 second beta-propeller domain-containing protein n=1 Tax=Halocaridina rubra TaxID=373956 RepID=A0AAN9AFT7_HALRR
MIMEEDTRVLYYWGPLLQCKPLITSSSKYLLAALESAIRVFSTDTGNLIKTLKGHSNEIVGFAPVFDKEDEFFSCDEYGKICHWSLLKDVKESNLMKEYQLKSLNTKKDKAVVATFLVKGSAAEFIVGVGKDTGKLFRYTNPTHKPVVLEKCAKLGSNKVAISHHEDCVIFLTKQHLQVVSLSSSKRASHHTGVNEITCVMCHPSKMSIATGNCIGEVVLWYNLFKEPIKQSLHWHSLPVADMAFSNTGSELYTGGGECVLVNWQLTQNKHRFLPRLGMPIKYVITDMRNEKIICAHLDSAFTVISAKDYKLCGSIQGVSMSIDNMEPYPAGLTYDPRTKCVILNGRSGHVQFYDIHHNKLLYQLDVAMENYINPERNIKLYNSEVEKVAISPDGSWLATLVYRDDFQSSREIRLIFWHFDTVSQRWTLNTSVHMPHDNYVNEITFMPSSKSENTAMCVSCSDDGKFKIWEVLDNSDIYKQSSMWGCRSIGFYRHLPATSASVAPDGSLIAVGFASILTIWTYDSCHLKGTLSQPYLRDHIRQIEFGRTENCSSMIVSRSDNWLCGWNLFTCSLSWKVTISSTCMAVDPLSSYMVVFSTTRDAYIFEPKSNLVYTKLENINNKSTLCAAFVPRLEKSTSKLGWTDESQLFIIDEAQRLKLIEPKANLRAVEAVIEGVIQEFAQDTVGTTPFSTLVAQTRVTDVAVDKSRQLGSAAFGVNVQNSSALLQKVLDESRVYRLDTFTTLAKEFCKLVLPEATTSADVEEEEDINKRIKKEESEVVLQRKSVKKKKKQNLERGLNSDFSGLLSILSSDDS